MIGVRSASSSSSSSSVTSRQEMLELFQPWVLATYGDSAKTKTITLRKAHRIQGSHSQARQAEIIKQILLLRATSPPVLSWLWPATFRLCSGRRRSRSQSPCRSQPGARRPSSGCGWRARAWLSPGRGSRSRWRWRRGRTLLSSLFPPAQIRWVRPSSFTIITTKL